MYKVGDKVRVRSDLKAHEQYGDNVATKAMEALAGQTVTISMAGHASYQIYGADSYWTDEMFEPVEEMSAVEAIRIQADMCNSVPCSLCPIDKMRSEMCSPLECAAFRGREPEKILEVLKQWKADHEKKPIETEFAHIVRVIESTGNTKKCVYEEEIPYSEDFDEAQERVLKEYYKNHDGNFFTVVERICRVKE